MSTSQRLEDLLGLRRVNLIEGVAIGIASPEVIRSWSHGEVKNPETINYRTLKPERGGLFCERIFGPVKDWECACGKYKRMKYKGQICDRCGVEVTLSRVRRERMGHIELAVPVTHIWFLKVMPSRIGLMLDMTARELERVVYYEDYMVIDPGRTPLKKHQLLTEQEYREALQTYGPDAFVAKMGGEAIRDALAQIDLEETVARLEREMEESRSKQIRKKLTKRIRLFRAFLESGTRPEWMVLTVLPVIPPDLRPLVPLEGGRFATSDLNDLYRRVINRNNRLKSLLQLRTPDVIIRNEKRMLQEAVDALLDNGRHGRPVMGAGNRPLKSLADLLRGKQGRFRQNLLGKRVDYSGRSVIVIGPELKLHQCGLPKKMALVLFEPFIIQQLKARGHAQTIKTAKRLIERQAPEVWDVLEEVTKHHPVLLNRAPTLHRLSIQAFEPVLIEGEAIRIHPLICTGYNADFDGDQMAVHVPLSIEAQLEARLLMLAPLNLFKPANGEPILAPTQDITLGCFYLTAHPRKPKPPRDKMPLFASREEVIYAFDEGWLKVHDWVLLANPDRGRKTIYGDPESPVIETTVGRVIFSEIWPAELGFPNKPMTKKELAELIANCYKVAGRERTVEVLDKVKELGFSFATRSGCSIGITDMVIPPERESEIEFALKQVEETERQYRRGILSSGERYNRIVDIWTQCVNNVEKVMLETLEKNLGKEEYNPLYLIVHSGARGNKNQVRQLAGLRGLMSKPSGEIIEKPILSNFREGLSVLDYFISTHGARKGLADTALKTADAGYLTRKLVDVAQDVIVLEEDCGTVNGIWISAVFEGDQESVSLKDRIVGRFAADDVVHPLTRQVIVQANEYIDEQKAELIEEAGVERVKVRSVLTCETKRGVCVKCYGLNHATGRLVELGEAVGIIAAQSIGEPGTQLTMRTFHYGGTASQIVRQPHLKAKHDGRVRFRDLRTVELADGNLVVLNKHGKVIVTDDEGRDVETHEVPMGAVLYLRDGDRVQKGQVFAKWDPYSVPVIAEVGGRVRFVDVFEGSTMRREIDPVTKRESYVIVEHKENLHPMIQLVDDQGNELGSYPIPIGAHIVVREGQKVKPGATLAKTPRKITKTRDITGGLPRVAELFEARRPKDAAEIAKIDGVVDIGPVKGDKRTVIVSDPESGVVEEHLIPMGKHLIVFKGDRVRKGQQLTEGPIDPHEILEVCGPQELQEHLVNEIQQIYRSQGVTINDKHIEIIIRQMLRKVRITDPGDTKFLWGEQVDKIDFYEENERVQSMGGKPADGVPILQGITKAALETDSWLSAASFQDTTRVLTEAAVMASVDYLRGFKENVIVGHIIPAGTGFWKYRSIEVKPLVEIKPSRQVEEPQKQVAGVEASGQEDKSEVEQLPKTLLEG